MKHQPTLILTAVVMLMASCSRDFDADNTPAPVAAETADEGYVVSVEQALTSLDNELAMIYGDDQTRAAQPRRRVKAIHNVAYDRVAPVTRSTDVPDDVADLFYIVEFADGQGSAVLGADKRVEPVVAILDETVLTPEDFASADIESDDITSYMAALMVNSANNGIINLDSLADPGTRLPIELNPVRERDTINVHKQAALLKSKWHQNSPFNNLYPYSGPGLHYPAGCGVIAVAQILAHNRYPEELEIYDIPFDWNIIDLFVTNPDRQSESNTEHLASFICNLGTLMNMTHDDSGTGTHIEDAAYALRHLGYRSVASHAFSYSDAQDMICNDQLVFLMRGENSSEIKSGHDWVVDGWNAYTVKVWEVTYDYNKISLDHKPVEISRELKQTINVNKIHCNFGWGGDCNGYYTYNLFVTNRSTYNSNFKMITYSLPNN